MTGGYPESQPPPFSTRPSGPSTTSRWQVLGRIEATRCGGPGGPGGPDLLSTGFSEIYDILKYDIECIYMCVCVCGGVWYFFNHPFLRYEIFKILLTYYKSHSQFTLEFIIVIVHHPKSGWERTTHINWQRARCAVMIRAFTKSSRDLNSKQLTSSNFNKNGNFWVRNHFFSIKYSVPRSTHLLPSKEARSQ